MRTPGSRNRDTADKRKAILEGALDLFLKRGLAATTLDSLCQALGIHRSTFYHLFPSKEALAVELFQASVEEIHQQIRQKLTHTKSAQEGLKSIVSSYLLWFRQHPQQGAFVWKVTDSELMNQHIQPVRAQQRAFMESLIDWLEPFRLRSEVRSLSPAMLAALVIGPARDFVRNRPDPEEFDEALEILPEAAWKAISS